MTNNPDRQDDAPIPFKGDHAPSSSLEAEIDAALQGLSTADLLQATPSSQKRPHISLPSDSSRRLKRGKVLRVTKDDIFVEFGPKSQGICPTSQFDPAPAEGDELEFQVERLDPFDNLLILCRPGVVSKADWGSLAIGTVVDARCTGMNRGGLEMEVAHHKAFMPAAHADIRHLEDLSILLGQKFACEIIELKKNSERMVLSRRKVLERERRDSRGRLMETIEVGQVRTATVVSLQDFGAFADIGGVDGLIPMSELAFERIKNASDVLKVGDVLDVKVIRVDKSGPQPKLTLSRRQCMSDPAIAAIQEITPGATITGRVTKLTEFGAFVEISPGVEGLVHITEITHDRLPNPVQALKRDQIVEAKVLNVDAGRKRISLSIKALKDAPQRQDRGGAGGFGQGRGGKGGERDDSHILRADDPEMRKLRARFSAAGSNLKGGLNNFPSR